MPYLSLRKDAPRRQGHYWTQTALLIGRTNQFQGFDGPNTLTGANTR